MVVRCSACVRASNSLPLKSATWGAHADALVDLLADIAFADRGVFALFAEVRPRRAASAAFPPGRRERFVHLLLHGVDHLLETRILGQRLQSVRESVAAGRARVVAQTPAEYADHIALLAE